MIEWMKEILGDAYTEDIDNKITARLTADYAPKADLEAANTAKSEAEAALAAANDKYKDVDIDALRADAEKYKQDEAITAALAALQKDSGYLFESGETPPPYAAGTGSTALHGADADTAMRQAMGLPIDN